MPVTTGFLPSKQLQQPLLEIGDFVRITEVAADEHKGWIGCYGPIVEIDLIADEYGAGPVYTVWHQQLHTNIAAIGVALRTKAADV